MNRTALAILSLAPAAAAQSLFSQLPPSLPPGAAGHGPDPASSLYGISMFAVQPPKPRQYKTHDLVTILIEESSKQSADQSLKTDKKYDADLSLNSLIDPWALLELQLRQGNLNNLQLLDIAAKSKFDGKGTYSRNDKFTMKIQAEILDVKPNGVLVLEAKKIIDKDGEQQSTILSGSCRLEDITTSNTILSTQLANLTLISRNEGQVKDAGKKGLIPRVLDAVFNI